MVWGTIRRDLALAKDQGGTNMDTFNPYGGRVSYLRDVSFQPSLCLFPKYLNSANTPFYSMSGNCSQCGTPIKNTKIVIIDVGKPVPDDIDQGTWAVMLALRTYVYPCGHISHSFGDVKIFPTEGKAWKFYEETKKHIES